MKIFVRIALIASTFLGCGANNTTSAVKADQGVRSPASTAAQTASPKFEQFVSIKINAADVNAYRALIANYAVFSRSETGNLLYAVYQSIDDPTQFEVHETWQSDEAHATHLATPEFATYSAQANACFSAPPVKQQVN